MLESSPLGPLEVYSGTSTHTSRGCLLDGHSNGVDIAAGPRFRAASSSEMPLGNLVVAQKGSISSPSGREKHEKAVDRG